MGRAGWKGVLVAAVAAAAGWGGPALAATWTTGDVVVGEIDTVGGITDGRYQVFGANGLLKETVRHGSLGGQTTGCRFDRTNSRLYTTNFDASYVVRFPVAHPHTADFSYVGSAHGIHPSSISFAADGQFYAGYRDGGADAARFTTSTGRPVRVQTYDLDVGSDGFGAQWVELARDQRTLLYTTQGRRVRRYDVSGAGAQLPDFATLPGTRAEGYFAVGLRLLADGSDRLLVADYRDIKLLSATGQVQRRFDAPAADTWFALALDPNGRSFWAGDVLTAQLYRFNIGTGQVDAGPFSTTFGVGGLCVLGEPVWSTTPSFVSVSDATVAEGDDGTTPTTVTLTLNRPHEIDLAVDVSTAPVTATEGADYLGVSRRVTFAPGQTTATVEVEAIGDLAGEPDETLDVVLANPSPGMALADSRGRVTIVDDDRNGSFLCRASALRVGADEPLLAGTCPDSLLTAASASAADGTTSATATGLLLSTEQHPDDLATKPAVGDLGRAHAEVDRVTVTSGVDTFVATGLVADAKLECGAGGAVTTLSSFVGSLVRNGETLATGRAAHVHFTHGTATIHINHYAGSMVRPLWIEKLPLGGDAVAAEVSAGRSGDPC